MVQEGSGRVGRRLTAILAADVVGYSRMMHDDEETTHARLTALMADAVKPTIAAHDGRIVKTTGDGLLAEFPSAVEAVRAAVLFQKRASEVAAEEDDEKRLLLRVGINVGDVIAEPNDIFGDGVNIAARLESICEPGGICVSASVHDQVRGRVDVDFMDIGEQNLKNIARPVRAYAISIGSGIAEKPVSSSFSAAPHLSIIVLPFVNIGSDPEQEYLVDAVTENLTTDISRVTGAFVIARNTAFTLKGKAVDVKRIGRELNVRYVLEGSVQRGGNRLRVNVQLIDAETGNHLWADRFDKPVADFFDMQDEIVSRLANMLDARLMAAEARRAEGMPNPGSMDMYFQGRASLNKGMSLETLTEAGRFFARAVALDPNNAEALAGASLTDVAIGAGNVSADRATRLIAAEAAATKAVSLAPDNALAHMALGVVYTLTGRAAQGIAECEQALVLDRNLTDAHAAIGLGKIFLGRPADTEGHIREALRLSPRDVFAFRWLYYVGTSKLLLGATSEAVTWLGHSIEANRNYPNAHFALAAALALIGSHKEAQAAVQAGLALNPNFTIRGFRAVMPNISATLLPGRELILDAMRLAGIPEG